MNNSIKSSYSFYNLGQYEPVVISDFPDIMVNMHGDVFSVSSGKKINPKCYTDNKNYNVVYTFDISGKRKAVRIHQLVSMAFDSDWYFGCIVHHKDENKYNNDIWNLSVTNEREHGKLHNPPKYYDIETVCDICGKKFTWASNSQAQYFRDLRRGKTRLKTCSRNCQSYAGRMKQLGRKI